MKQRAKIHCLVCETDQWKRTDGRAYIHDGVTEPVSECPGSGKDRHEMLTVMREFDSRDNTTQVQRHTDVVDNGESILLTNTLRIRGDLVAEIVTDVGPQDTLRLIRQLVSIARARGLVEADALSIALTGKPA